MIELFALVTPDQSSKAQGAVVVAVLGGGLFLSGLALSLFGTGLKKRAAVASSLMIAGGLFLVILFLEATGDAPSLEPARPGPYPVPQVSGEAPPPR